MKWHKIKLIFSGVYSLLWGATLLIAPDFFFPLIGVIPENKEFWMLLGIAVSISSLMYFLAVGKIRERWWLVGLAVLGKTFGAVVAVYQVRTGNLETSYYWQVFLNDILWIPALAVITYDGFKSWQNTELDQAVIPFPRVLEHFHTNLGVPLSELNQKQPVMLIFLRHFGCTFCREAMQELSKMQLQIEAEGKQLVFVHMANHRQAAQYLAKYGFSQPTHVSDPFCQLYQSLGLKRASFTEVFGLKSWLRGFKAGILKGHGVGKLVGDGFRMPGVFIVYQNEILQSFKHQTASDVPDYQELMACPV